MIAPHIWTTQAGETIEVRWMTTPHLIHSFNLVMRQNNFSRAKVERRMKLNKGDVFQAMYHEIAIRQQVRWRPDDQLDINGIQRETPLQLAMLRALLDTRYPPAEEVVRGIDSRPFDELIPSFYYRAQTVIDQVFADPVKYAPVITKFTEYRMAQA